MNGRIQRRYRERSEPFARFEELAWAELPSWVLDRDLVTLELAGNELTDLPAELALVSNSLELLDLRRNPLTQVPEVVRKLKRLQELYLCHTAIRHLPLWLAEMPTLEYVQVHGCPLESRPANPHYRIWPQPAE